MVDRVGGPRDSDFVDFGSEASVVDDSDPQAPATAAAVAAIVAAPAPVTTDAAATAAVAAAPAPAVGAAAIANTSAPAAPAAAGLAPAAAATAASKLVEESKKRDAEDLELKRYSYTTLTPNTSGLSPPLPPWTGRRTTGSGGGHTQAALERDALVQAEHVQTEQGCLSQAARTGLSRPESLG